MPKKMFMEEVCEVQSGVSDKLEQMGIVLTDAQVEELWDEVDRLLDPYAYSWYKEADRC